MAVEDAEERERRRKRRDRRVGIAVAVILVGGAVAQELSKPAAARTWTGRVAGLVPYDLRWPPTVDRFRAALWNPDSDALFRPQPFGVGWTVNVAAMLHQLQLATASRGQAG